MKKKLVGGDLRGNDLYEFWARVFREGLSVF